MSKEKEKIKLEDLVEYDGIWYRKGEGDKCKRFIMIDLKDLIAQEKQKSVEEIIEIVQSEIAKADKHEIAPLQRIMVKLINSK